MAYTNDPIYQEMVREIAEEFREYYEDNWDEGEWDDFKEQALQELYNSYIDQKVTKSYHNLLFCLRVIKEEDAEYGGTFSDWDNPQKIFNLAYYFVAKSYFNELDEDFNEDLDEENEEADEEVFALFQP